jgi:hypothetical protein
MDSNQHDDSYPERWDYRVLAEGDGSDGEHLSVVQAWYWPGEDLPRSVDPVPPSGGHIEALRRDLRGMLTATEKPPLVFDRAAGAFVEGMY